MKNIVQGYSGIIAPQNLATNGSFRINQRGEFLSRSPAVNGSPIADCWRIASSNVDFLEVVHNQNGNMNFKGYGRKGQTFEIHNREFNNLGEQYEYNSLGLLSNDNSATLTASMIVMNLGSIPISAKAQPCEVAGISERLRNVETYVGTDKSVATKTCIFKNRGYSMTVPHLGWFRLEEDGEFNFHISGFKVVSGAFQDLPVSIPVNYTDDLMRCQRFFRKIDVAIRNRATHKSGGLYRAAMSMSHGTMEATPSLAIVNITASGTYDTNGTFSAEANPPTQLEAGIDGFRLNVDFTSPNAANFGCQYDCDVILEVV